MIFTPAISIVTREKQTMKTKLFGRHVINRGYLFLYGVYWIDDNFNIVDREYQQRPDTNDMDDDQWRGVLEKMDQNVASLIDSY